MFSNMKSNLKKCLRARPTWISNGKQIMQNTLEIMHNIRMHIIFVQLIATSYWERFSICYTSEVMGGFKIATLEQVMETSYTLNSGKSMHIHKHMYIYIHKIEPKLWGHIHHNCTTYSHLTSHWDGSVCDPSEPHKCLVYGRPQDWLNHSSLKLDKKNEHQNWVVLHLGCITWNFSYEIIECVYIANVHVQKPLSLSPMYSVLPEHT
jgi:hypothetical protein